MAWLFSKRCKQALNKKKIKVSIPLAVRFRILKALQNHDNSYYETDDTGFNYQTSILIELPDKIKAEIGCKDLLAFPEIAGGAAVRSDLEAFILRGNYPPYLFDTLELFYESVSEENKYSFQHSFNQIMEESDLPWRMADGKIFPVDSAYIEEEILRRSYSLLHAVKFEGALKEFEKARADFADSDYESAVQNAYLAVESTIKGILKIERAKPGELFRKLIDSGVIPEYYSGFLKAFEENILRCVAIIRNEELGVGHGQGLTVNIVPPALAELAVNLAGVLINFLIKRHLEQVEEGTEVQEDDQVIPF